MASIALSLAFLPPLTRVQQQIPNSAVQEKSYIFFFTNNHYVNNLATTAPGAFIMVYHVVEVVWTIVVAVVMTAAV